MGIKSNCRSELKLARVMVFILISNLLLFCRPAYAQSAENSKISTNPKAIQGQIAYYRQLYNLAFDMQDLQSEKFCLLNLVMLDRADTGSLAKLADVYFTLTEYAPALKAATKYYKVNSTNISILRLIAVSNEKLNHYQEALITFTELFYLTQSYYYQYQAAYMEYELFRYPESIETLKQVLQNGADRNETVGMTDEESHELQQVPLKAACYNLMGMVYLDLKDKAPAKQSFETALKSFPGFKLAQRNIQLMQMN